MFDRKLLARLTATTAMVIVLSGCASSRRDALFGVREEVDKHHYDVALTRLATAQRKMKPDDPMNAEVYYWKGLCYSGLGRRVEAKATMRYVADHFPETAYGYEAILNLTGKPPALTGETLTSGPLREELYRYIHNVEQALKKTRHGKDAELWPTTLIVGSEILSRPKEPTDRWQEKWIVHRHGHDVYYTVTFQPSPTGKTRVSASIPPEGIK